MAVPDRVLLARALWKNTGQQRPEFAIDPEEGQESVWDYPRPPALVADDREVLVRAGEYTIARTTQAIRICETASPPTFYIPADDVIDDHLRKSPSQSFCEWKGQATYWTLQMPQQPMRSDIGWSYEQPFEEFAVIRGYLSFFPARVECFVDGHSVEPQSGGFYGGWITPDVVGPFKGDPGTSGW